jgi:hypothetical protein
MWRDALVAKRTEELAAFALPEARQRIKSDLANTKSNIHYHLYGSNFSAYQILTKVDRLGIALMKHKSLDEFGSGVTVIYYDLESLKIQFPIQDDEMQRLLKEGVIFSLFLFRIDNEWYASYEFGSDK